MCHDIPQVQHELDGRSSYHVHAPNTQLNVFHFIHEKQRAKYWKESKTRKKEAAAVCCREEEDGAADMRDLHVGHACMIYAKLTAITSAGPLLHV